MNKWVVFEAGRIISAGFGSSEADLAGLEAKSIMASPQATGIPLLNVKPKNDAIEKWNC